MDDFATFTITNFGVSADFIDQCICISESTLIESLKKFVTSILRRRSRLERRCPRGLLGGRPSA